MEVETVALHGWNTRAALGGRAVAGGCRDWAVHLPMGNLRARAHSCRIEWRRQPLFCGLKPGFQMPCRPGS
eukprot:7269051-Pyramimonas_sp.AAC.1